MRTLNLLLRFLLELSALAALWYWGYHAVDGEAARIALGLSALLVFVLLWWLFAAHKAKFPPSRPWKVFLGFLFLEAAAACLALAGQVLMAEVFALLIAANSALLYRWPQ